MQNCGNLTLYSTRATELMVDGTVLPTKSHIVIPIGLPYRIIHRYLCVDLETGRSVLEDLIIYLHHMESGDGVKELIYENYGITIGDATGFKLLLDVGWGLRRYLNRKSEFRYLPIGWLNPYELIIGEIY